MDLAEAGNKLLVWQQIELLPGEQTEEIMLKYGTKIVLLMKVKSFN